MVSSVKIVTNEMIKQVLKYKDLIPAVEQGMKEFSEENVVQPDRNVLYLQQHKGLFYNMPAYSPNRNVLIVKQVGAYPHNHEKNLPSRSSQLLLFNASEGGLLSLMDAEEISFMRTAAASAVATKHLSIESPKILAVLGAGNQAYSHIMALTSQYAFDKILLWNRTPKNGEKLCRKVESAVHSIKFCHSVVEAVKNADIIVTVTDSPTPLLEGKYLKDGVHINCVGTPRTGYRELDDACLDMCDLYVDSRVTILKECGDTIDSKDILGEIGEIVGGKIKADRSKRTVFRSTGIAIEDVVAAELVWKKIQGENL